MIINCDSCGKSTSNRLLACPYCQQALKKQENEGNMHGPREILFALKHTSIRKM